MSLAAGARRTDGAYGRFLHDQRSFDVLLVNYEEDGTAVYDFDEIARLPWVLDSARANWEYVGVGEEGGTPGLAGDDDSIGTRNQPLQGVGGKASRPVTPRRGRRRNAGGGSERARGREHDRGGHRPISSSSSSETTSRPRWRATERRRIRLLRASPRPVGSSRACATISRDPGGRVKVVGIARRRPRCLHSSGLCCVHHTPAVAALEPESEHEALIIRLRRGADDVAAFRRELVARGAGRDPQLYLQAEHSAGVERSIDVQKNALWLLAGLVALVGGLILFQLLGRFSWTESADHPTLAALGMSRAQRGLLGVTRAAAVGLAGGVAGSVVAVALSPIFRSAWRARSSRARASPSTRWSSPSA